MWTEDRNIRLDGCLLLLLFLLIFILGMLEILFHFTFKLAQNISCLLTLMRSSKSICWCSKVKNDYFGMHMYEYECQPKCGSQRNFFSNHHSHRNEPNPSSLKCFAQKCLFWMRSGIHTYIHVTRISVYITAKFIYMDVCLP